MYTPFRAACRAVRPVRTVPFSTGLLAALLLALLPAAAHAGDLSSVAPHDTNFYISAKIGPAIGFAKNFTSGSGNSLGQSSASSLIGGFGMAFGYSWADEQEPLRAEIELMDRTAMSYDKSPLFSGSSSNASVGSTIQNITALLKGYYHFDVESPIWSPFVSFGAGISRTDVTGHYTPAGGGTTQISKITDSPAWTVGAGVSMLLGSNLVDDIELSYVNLGKIDYGLPPAQNLTSKIFGAVQLTVGLRYNF